jgi:hypothetical protein
MADAAELDFYASQGRMTDPGRLGALFDGLPTDIADLAQVVQGLVLHEHWSSAYGVTLAPERRAQAHLRSVEAMLETMMALDDRPLTEARDLETRLIGNCRDFSLLAAAMLRHQGAPARPRCGFGTYFDSGRLVDHWVCECWDASEGRWRLVDAQIDAFQASRLKPDFDVLDTPRDRFVIAGDAWVQARSGRLDPKLCGIMDMWGLWFIGGNVIRDAAALAKMEMLPWDSWGAMVEPDEESSPQDLAFLDAVAAQTIDPDSAPAVRRLYERDERLRVPPMIFNAILNRTEVV